MKRLLPVVFALLLLSPFDAGAQENDQSLAEQLTNPISSLISVPFQYKPLPHLLLSNSEFHSWMAGAARPLGSPRRANRPRRARFATSEPEQTPPLKASGQATTPSVRLCELNVV